MIHCIIQGDQDDVQGRTKKNSNEIKNNYFYTI